MVELAGLSVDPATKLDDGSAYEVYQRMIAAQGGDPDWVAPLAAHQAVVRADRPGVIIDVEALAVGLAAWRLGAGRARKEDAVSALAGVTVRVRPGDEVSEGDALFDVYADDTSHLEAGLASLAGAVTIGDEAPAASSVLLEVIGD